MSQPLDLMQLYQQRADGVVLMDESGTIIAWDCGMERITGLAAAAVIGRPIWEVQHECAFKEDSPAPNGYSQIKEMAQSFFQNGTAPFVGIPVERLIVRPDGEKRRVESVVFPIPTAAGFMAVSIMRDRTDAHRQEAEDLRYRQQLEAMVKLRTAELEAANQRLQQEIAERQKAEATLRLNENKYRTLVEVAPMGVFLIAAGKFVYANPAGIRLVGAKNISQLVNLPAIEFLPPDERALSQHASWQMNIGDEASHLVETSLVRLDGEKIDVEGVGLQVLHEGMPATQLFLTNVTERKRLDEEMRRREEHYRILSSQAPVGIFLTDPNGDDLYLNEAWYQMTGMSPESALGKGWVQSVAPEDRERVSQVWAEALPHESEVVLEYKLVTTDQGRIDVSVKAIPLHDETGHLIGYLGTVTDISRLKFAERALRESEQRLRELAETIQEVFWLQDAATGMLLYLSPGFERIWGFQPTGVYEDPLLLVKYIHPEDLAVFQTAFVQQQLGQGMDATFRVVHPLDSAIYWVRARTFPIRDASGKTVRWAGIAEEITGQKRMEEQLRLSEEKFGRVFQVSPDLITISTWENERMLDVNQSFLNVIGLKREAVIGKTIDEVYHWVSDGQRLSIREELSANGRASNIEVPFSRGNGELRTFLLAAEMVDISGQQCVLAIYRDITERRRANDRLARQLQESLVLQAISQHLAGSLDLPVILQQIADAAATLIQKADNVSLHLQNETTGLLEPVAVSCRQPNTTPIMLSFRVGEGIAGKVFELGQAINVASVLEDDRFIPYEDNGGIQSLLVIPLRTIDKLLGTISVGGKTTGMFSTEDERLLNMLASQAALAIEKAQLLKNERAERQLTETLVEISTAMNTSLDYEDVLHNLFDRIERLVPYDSANVMLIEGGRTRMFLMHGYEEYGVDIANEAAALSFKVEDTPSIQKMVLSGKPHIISDTFQDPGWIVTRSSQHIRSWAGAPIVVQGRTMAVFCLNKTDPNFYQPKHALWLAAVASQAGLALQNASLFAAVEQKLKEVDTLYHISQGVAASLDIDVVLDEVVRLIQETFDYYHIHIYLLEASSGDLVLRHGCGPKGMPLVVPHHRIPHNMGIIGHVAQTGQPFMTNDVRDVPFFLPHPRLGDTEAELAVPLQIGERVIGVINIEHRKPRFFTDYDLQLITAVADQLAVALEKATLYSDLQASLRHEQTARAQMVQSEKLAALGRIVASVAHELNNPLQAIQNALYLIKIEEALSQQAMGDLQTALNEAGRMADLIARLRETYRPVASEEFEPESLNYLVEEVQKLIATHLRHHDIRFLFIPMLDLPVVQVIRDQIKQVILNISLNAVEAMGAGGELKIWTYWEAHSAEVLLAIQDTGPGIPEDVLPNIFDPFITTKDGGTGLGLSITYDIVRRHNGRIEVNSQRGKGTTFRVWLPMLQPAVS